MGKLTNWLDAFKLTGLDRHPDYPALVKPPNFLESPSPDCLGCPQVGKDGHKKYGCGKLTAPLPTANRPWVKVFGILQYLLHRISADLFPPYGAGSGFMFYGANAINFATQLGFHVTSVDEVDPRIVHVTNDGFGDIRAVPLFTIMRANWGAPGRSFLTVYGSLQPNSIGKPGGGCIIDGKVMARLRKVHVVDAYNAILTFDQDMSGLMVDNRYDQTEPFVPSVTLIGHYSDKEKWTRVVPPSILKCHRQVVKVTPAQLPADKKLSLLRRDLSYGRCADPKPVGADGQPPTMQLWVKLQGQEELIDKTSEVFSRFKSVRIGPGADERGQYRAMLCLGTKDHNDVDSFVDLVTEQVEYFTVVYYAEVPDNYTGNDWCTSGRFSRRCARSIKDESGSFYNMSDGEAHLSNGEEWYCEARREYEIKETIDGKYEIVWHKNVHTEGYSADCSQYGVCPGYVPINDTGEGTRSFTLHGTANYILKELLIGQDIALVQYWPGYPNYYVKRMGRPTIHGLTTAVPSENPTDWSPNVSFIQTGPSIVGDFNEKEVTAEYDEWGQLISAGGTILDPLIGSAWDGRVSFVELTFPNAPPPGIFPSLLAGWTTKLDPLRRNYSDTTDHYKSLRYYEDDCAVRAERDAVDARTFGRGVSQATRIVGADEKFLLPNLDVNDGTEGQVQDRGDCTFEWFETNKVAPGGWQYGGEIIIKKLIATGKPPRGSIKSAVIAAASIDGDGTIKLELKNQQETWSRLRNEGPYNSWNEIFTFNTGGKIFRPPDFLQIRSSETRDSSFGGSNDWVAIGDAAWIDHGDDLFKAHRFTVVNGGAYLGATEPDFGQTTQFVTFDPAGGYYQVTEAELMLETNEPGTVVNSEAVTSGAVLADAYEIVLAGDIPFASGQYVQVEGTNEVMQISGYDQENKKIYVSRGVSTLYPAAPIPDGTTIKLVPVYEPATGKVFTAVQSSEGEEKPTIAIDQFWFDPVAVRYYFSELNLLDYVTISFYVTDDTGTTLPTRGRVVYSHRIFETIVDSVGYTYPVFDTGRTEEQFDGDGAPTKVYLNGAELEIITSGLPEAGKVLRTVDWNNHVVLQFHWSGAGQSGRIEIDPGETSTFAIDVADVPEFATGAGWGRKRAVAWLHDENGWCAAEVANLVGKTINFVRHEQVLSPDSAPALAYAKWKEEIYTAVGGTWILTDRGIGKIYLARAVINAFRTVEGRKVCVEIS